MSALVHLQEGDEPRPLIFRLGVHAVARLFSPQIGLRTASSLLTGVAMTTGGATVVDFDGQLGAVNKTASPAKSRSFLGLDSFMALSGDLRCPPPPPSTCHPFGIC